MTAFFHWIDSQIQWVKSFFNEPDGKGSNKRLLSSAVVAVFLVAYLKIAITKEDLFDMPATWALMIAGIIGLNIADRIVKLKYKNGKDGG